MIIDSNTFGWLLSVAVAVMIIFKFWKRAVKFLIFAVAAVFVLIVVQFKTAYDAVVQPNKEDKTKKTEVVKDKVLRKDDSIEIKHEKKDETVPLEKPSKVMVHAKYDTITKKIEIEDIEILNE